MRLTSTSGAVAAARAPSPLQSPFLKLRLQAPSQRANPFNNQNCSRSQPRNRTPNQPLLAAQEESKCLNFSVNHRIAQAVTPTLAHHRKKSHRSLAVGKFSRKTETGWEVLARPGPVSTSLVALNSRLAWRRVTDLALGMAVDRVWVWSDQ